MLTPQQITELRTSAGFSSTPDVSKPSSSSFADTLKQSAKAYDVSRAQISPKPAGPSTLSKVAGYVNNAVNPLNRAIPAAVEDVKQTASNVKDRIMGTGESAGKSSIERGTGAVSDIASGATNVVADAIPGAKTVMGAIGTAANKIADLNEEASNKLSQIFGYESPRDWAVKDPEGFNKLSATLGTIGSVGNIAGTIAGAGEIPKVPGAIDATVSKIKPALNAVTEKVKGIMPEKAPIVDPAIALEKAAISDATPAYSKKLIDHPGIKNADGTVTPRITEGGTMSGRTVNSTQLETEAGKELAKIPEYQEAIKNNATALEKYQLVKDAIPKKAEAMRQSLRTEKSIIPKREVVKMVDKAVNSATEGSLLLTKSDPVISNYMRVAENAANKVSGNLEGVLDMRQALDDAYKNARGKMAFGDSKIAPLDEIHSAARDSLTQYMIDTAKNTDVKAALKAQWDLYRASDELLAKAEAEGGSGIERLMQKNPKTTKIVKTGLKATALGAGLHVLP